MASPIEFEGLVEAQRAFASIGRDAEKQFRLAGHAVAAAIVIPAAQARAAGLGKLEARAARTLTATTDAAGASVLLGKGFAGALGAEFGAYRNQERRGPSGRQYRGLNQFQPWLGNGEDAGYFLWPSIRSNDRQIVERYATELEPLWERYFPDG